MIDQTHTSPHHPQARDPDPKQPASTVDRTIRIPFPIKEVHRQLDLIFTAPIVAEHSLGYRSEYTGRVNGDDIEMGLVTRHPRIATYHKYTYLIRGRLRADPAGTVLEMTFIRPGKIGIKWSIGFLLLITVLYAGDVYRDGFRGMELLAATIGMVVVLSFFIALYYWAVSVGRRRAVKDVETFLMKRLSNSR